MRSSSKGPHQSQILVNRSNPHSKQSKCPAADVDCYGCNKRGHFHKMCLSTNKPAGTEKSGKETHSKHTGKKSVHEIGDEDPDPQYTDSDFHFDTIDILGVDKVDGVVNKNQAFANIKFKPSDTIVKCKIDTGPRPTLCQPMCFCYSLTICIKVNLLDYRLHPISCLLMAEVLLKCMGFAN